MMSAAEILRRAEVYRDDTARNLSRLVRLRSLSGQEREVNAELANQMRAAGFDAVAIDGLGNVIGRIGDGKRTLAIDAHMDTVDVGNPANWEFDPFGGEIRDGWVLGRGTVDQEGGAAAMVTAGRILKDVGFAGNLSFVCTGTVMEEDCDGLCWKYLIEEGGLRPDLVISTEPTSLRINRGQRGRMEIAVTFRGISAHGSAPERGRNAVYPAASACLEIAALNDRLRADPFLGKGSVAVTDMRASGPSLCALADHARLHLDRRLTLGETRETAVAEIEAIVRGTDATVEVLRYDEVAYTGLRYGMEKYYPTWLLPEDHDAVVRGVAVGRDLFGAPPPVDRWTFSTNGVTINGLHGIPVIGFGPGDEPMAHAPNEKVAIADLVKASAFYAAYALRMASEA